MFSSQWSDNLINQIHESSLRTVSNEKNSTFNFCDVIKVSVSTNNFCDVIEVSVFTMRIFKF